MSAFTQIKVAEAQPIMLVAAHPADGFGQAGGTLAFASQCRVPKGKYDDRGSRHAGR